MRYKLSLTLTLTLLLLSIALSGCLSTGNSSLSPSQQIQVSRLTLTNIVEEFNFLRENGAIDDDTFEGIVKLEKQAYEAIRVMDLAFNSGNITDYDTALRQLQRILLQLSSARDTFAVKGKTRWTPSPLQPSR